MTDTRKPWLLTIDLHVPEQDWQESYETEAQALDRINAIFQLGYVDRDDPELKYSKLVYPVEAIRLLSVYHQGGA